MFDSLEKGIEAAQAIDTEEIFIFGGASIYAEALPFVDRLYLTVIDETDNGADAFFPEYEEFNKVLSEEMHPEHIPPYQWVTLEK